jgi:hypothetical protein
MIDQIGGIMGHAPLTRRDHTHAAHRSARDHLELARSLSVTFSGVRRDLVFEWGAIMTKSSPNIRDLPVEPEPA